jgi:hypothetical protein
MSSILTKFVQKLDKTWIKWAKTVENSRDFLMLVVMLNKLRILRGIKSPAIF